MSRLFLNTYNVISCRNTLKFEQMAQRMFRQQSDSLNRFEQVERSKTLIILYPFLENSTTSIAIIIAKSNSIRSKTKREKQKDKIFRSLLEESSECHAATLSGSQSPAKNSVKLPNGNLEVMETIEEDVENETSPTKISVKLPDENSEYFSPNSMDESVEYYDSFLESDENSSSMDESDEDSDSMVESFDRVHRSGLSFSKKSYGDH